MTDTEISDYGFATIIKEYARFPRILSLPCHMEHGWTSLSLPLATDLTTDKQLMLVFSNRRKQAWREKSRIPVAVMGAPFVHYRRMRNHKIYEEATGTVAFPSHSCYGVETIIDLKKYCDELQKLPNAYQPITICLHIHDYRKEIIDVYMQQGFKVVTAGDQYSSSFPMKFYEILCSHKYATSNVIGSYAFYAVEMNIPFFIVGDIAVMNNYGNDPNVPKSYSIIDFPVGRVAQEMFSTGPTNHISEKQKQFVIEEMGMDICLSRNMMGILFWKYKVIEVLKVFISRYRSLSARIKKHRNMCYINKNNLLTENTIFTHLTEEEKIALHENVKKISRNKRIVAVEIGSYLGASTCFIVKALSKSSSIICIDTWGNDAMKYVENDSDSNPRDTYNEFNINTAEYRDKIVKIRKRSSDAIQDVKCMTDNIDFIFIDGNHLYDSVQEDWNNYSPLLRKNSVVIFHDVGWAEGVRKVIKECVAGRAKMIVSLPNMQGFIMR